MVSKVKLSQATTTTDDAFFGIPVVHRDVPLQPDDVVLARSGTLSTNGTDGKMYYDIASGDLDAAGHYKLQGRVSLGTSTYYTTIHNFQVHCNL